MGGLLPPAVHGQQGNTPGYQGPARDGVPEGAVFEPRVPHNSFELVGRTLKGILPAWGPLHTARVEAAGKMWLV